MPIDAAAVVSTLKSAGEIADKLRGETKEELRSAGSALTELLITARVQALDLIQEKALLVDEKARLNGQIHELEREIRRLSDFDEKAGRYERVRSSRGTFTFREKGATGASPHFCPNCYSSNKISILHCYNPSTGHHSCPACKTILQV